MNGDGQVGRSDSAAKELQIFVGTVAANERRLQYKPIGAQFFGLPDLGNLLGNGRAEYGKGKRHPATDIFGDPPHQHEALAQR